MRAALPRSRRRAFRSHSPNVLAEATLLEISLSYIHDPGREGDQRGDGREAGAARGDGAEHEGARAVRRGDSNARAVLYAPPYSRDADPHDATSLLYLRAQVQGRLASMEGEFDSARTNQKTMAQRFNALQARPLFLCRAVVVTVLRPLA